MSDDYCCTPDSGDCCGLGSWCCARAGKHEHPELDEPECTCDPDELALRAPRLPRRRRVTSWSNRAG